MTEYRHREFFDRDEMKAGTEIIGSVGERAVSLWNKAFGDQPDGIFALTVEEEDEEQRLIGIYSHYEGACARVGSPFRKSNQQRIFQIDKDGDTKMMRTLILLAGQNMVFHPSPLDL